MLCNGRPELVQDQLSSVGVPHLPDGASFLQLSDVLRGLVQDVSTGHLGWERKTGSMVTKKPNTGDTAL